MGELARRATTPAKAKKPTPAKKTPAKAAAHEAAGKKSPARKAPAKQAAKKLPGKKAPGKKATAKKAPPQKVPPHEAQAHHAQKKAAKAASKKKSTNRSADQAPGRTTSRRHRHSATSEQPIMGLPQLPAPPSDPLTVLGLKEPLNAARLRRAWRDFAVRHHPDRGGDASTFARGQNAYNELQRRLSCDK